MAICFHSLEKRSRLLVAIQPRVAFDQDECGHAPFLRFVILLVGCGTAAFQHATIGLPHNQHVDTVDGEVVVVVGDF